MFLLYLSNYCFETNGRQATARSKIKSPPFYNESEKNAFYHYFSLFLQEKKKHTDYQEKIKKKYVSFFFHICLLHESVSILYLNILHIISCFGQLFSYFHFSGIPWVIICLKARFLGPPRLLFCVKTSTACFAWEVLKKMLLLIVSCIPIQLTVLSQMAVRPQDGAL